MMIKVEDAVRAISNVDDYAGSAKALAATTLRSMVMKMMMLVTGPDVELGTINHSDKSLSLKPGHKMLFTSPHLAIHPISIHPLIVDN